MQRLSTIIPIIGLALALTATADAQQLSNTIQPGEVMQWQETGIRFLLVDVRTENEYAIEHAEGAVNIPYYAMKYKRMPADIPIVFYCNDLSLRKSRQALADFQGQGYMNGRLMDGGLSKWEALDGPLVGKVGLLEIPLVDYTTPEDLEEAQQTRVINYQLIDLRPAEKFQDFHLQGSLNVPLQLNQNNRLLTENLEPKLKQVIAGKDRLSVIVLVDDGDGNALQQAEFLRRLGYMQVRYLQGGIPAWKYMLEKREGDFERRFDKTKLKFTQDREERRRRK